MTHVKITWKAFGSSQSAEIEIDSMDNLLESLFAQTNAYRGALWNLIEAVLPEDRTHTALSVGDEVEIDGVAYRCADIGWEKI